MATQFPAAAGSFFPPISDTIYDYVFSGAGTANVVPPTGATSVLFSVTGNADFFVKSGAGAAVPAANKVDGSGSEANPAGRSLVGSSTFSIAVGAACTVSCAFYF